MRSYKNIAYGSDPAQKLDLYLPETDTFDLFVYFHGGGLEAGSKDNDAVIFSYLAEKGIASISAEYRMYPTAHYPDFIEDAASACAWAKAHIGEYGNCSRIFVGGSSAGGYLSMMLCFDARWLGAHGLTTMDFAGYVHDAGQSTKHYNVLREMGVEKGRIIVDEAAPLFHIGADENYPSMLFIVSDNDMQNRYEQTMLLISTLKHFGHEGERVKLQIMNGKHCAYVNAADEKGDSIFGKLIYDFIKGV